jgi:hypothetical protein
MGENKYIVFGKKNQEKRDLLGDRGEDGRILLKFILKNRV